MSDQGKTVGDANQARMRIKIAMEHLQALQVRSREVSDALLNTRDEQTPGMHESSRMIRAKLVELEWVVARLFSEFDEQLEEW